MKCKRLLTVFLFAISPLLVLASEYFVATANVNVRSGAGSSFAISFTLQKGEEVEVLNKTGNWFQVKYLGETGFVHSKYLVPKSNVKGESLKKTDEEFSAGLLLIILGLAAFCWALPILIIIGSNKTTSSEKLAWIIAVLFISWFAWIFYILLAPIKRKG